MRKAASLACSLGIQWLGSDWNLLRLGLLFRRFLGLAGIEIECSEYFVAVIAVQGPVFGTHTHIPNAALWIMDLSYIPQAHAMGRIRIIGPLQKQNKLTAIYSR